MNWYWLNHMEVSPVSMNISARVKKEHGKDTYKKGLPQYLCFNDTISFLFSWQICIILPQKAFFLFFFFFLQLDLYWQLHSSVARLFSGKIIDNHSSINMDFIWLVTWPGFKRFWRKRIYRLKTYLLVIIIFYNKDHQLSIARSSSCSCWDHFSFLFASHPYLNWWHIFFFEFLFFFISDSETFDVSLSFTILLYIFYKSLILNWTSTCWELNFNMLRILV